MSSLPYTKALIVSLAAILLVWGLALHVVGQRDVGADDLYVALGADELHEAMVAAAPDAASQRRAVLVPPKRVLGRESIAYGRGSTLTVSSTHLQWTGEGQAIALVDGDPGTRWSSAYADDQFVILDLGRPATLTTLRLHWETASAAHYRVQGSLDGENWRQLAEYTAYPVGPSVELVPLNATVQYLRLDLIRRQNPAWGFSLYEIEVLERPDAGS